MVKPAPLTVIPAKAGIQLTRNAAKRHSMRELKTLHPYQKAPGYFDGRPDAHALPKEDIRSIEKSPSQTRKAPRTKPAMFSSIYPIPTHSVKRACIGWMGL